MEGSGAIGDGDGVLRADVLGKLLLELIDPRAGGEVVGLQGLGDGGDVSVRDVLPAVGDGVGDGGHAAAKLGSTWVVMKLRNSSIVTHSVLVPEL